MSFPPIQLTAHDDTVCAIPEPAHTGLTLVVFIRGHWCPYCRRYLTKLEQRQAAFAEAGVRLLVVSPEPTGTSASLVRQLGLSFSIVSDADGQMIEAWGVRNRFTGMSANLPHPSVFLLLPDGEVAFRSIDRNYKRRTTMRTLFQQIASHQPVSVANS